MARRSDDRYPLKLHDCLYCLVRHPDPQNLSKFIRCKEQRAVPLNFTHFFTHTGR